MFEKFAYSKAEMKVLEFLLPRSGETHVREIAKKSGVSVSTASAALKKLERGGVVTKAKKGNMVFYAPNAESVIARQLKVFLTISGIVGIIERLKPLSSRVILFGSCAEGTDVEQSDIDLFVLSNQKDLARRAAASNRRISAIVLSNAEYAALGEKDKPLFERINKGIELWRS